MNKLFIVVFLLVSSLGISAQNCNSPASSIVFQQNYNQLASMRNDQARLNKAEIFAMNNCLLVYQVKQIADLFADDITRLSFIESAYQSLYDKENAYDLYDAFAYFSTAMRFHDFVNDPGTNRRPIRHNPPVYNDRYDFPDYQYPAYNNYNDVTPCENPLPDDMFYSIIRDIFKQQTDEAKAIMAIQLAESNCLTVAQIMKLGSLIEQESRRLDYLKRSYEHTYDIGNYHYNNQLFSNKQYYNEFDVFVRDRRGRPVHVVHEQMVPCRIPESEFSDIVQSIKQQSFDNTQLSLARQIIKAKQCFSAAQIRQLVDIFSFESSKLDIAKFSYPYCIDKSNYYKINSAFSYSSSVEELTEYIQSVQ